MLFRFHLFLFVLWKHGTSPSSDILNIDDVDKMSTVWPCIDPDTQRCKWHILFVNRHVYFPDVTQKVLLEAFSGTSCIVIFEIWTVMHMNSGPRFCNICIVIFEICNICIVIFEIWTVMRMNSGPQFCNIFWAANFVEPKFQGSVWC
jgi:hypothetical protein